MPGEIADLAGCSFEHFRLGADVHVNPPRVAGAPAGDTVAVSPAYKLPPPPTERFMEQP